MERRVLLAIFLAFLVLYVWQALFVKPVPEARAGERPPSTAATATPPGTVRNPAPRRPRRRRSRQAGADSAPAAAPLVARAAERDVRVETRDVIAVFTNRGARLKSWRLKHYLDHRGSRRSWSRTSSTAQPLPFTLRTPNDAVTATLNDALYTVSRSAGRRGRSHVAGRSALRVSRQRRRARGEEVPPRSRVVHRHGPRDA